MRRFRGSAEPGRPAVETAPTIAKPVLSPSKGRSSATETQSAQADFAREVKSVNAWGFNHHVVNVMWANLSGLSDNWDKEVFFLRDIADGQADGIINAPRPDLVQFVTMQELSESYDAQFRPWYVYVPVVVKSHAP